MMISNARKGSLIFSLFLAVYLLFPRPALAYIDPGSGSYIFQIILAGFLTALVFIKQSWGRIKDFFVSVKKKK